MKEVEKTNKIRGEMFFDKYCQGKGIDIGSGGTLVVPNAEPFDIEDGDANIITKYRSSGAYDFVHSSHCLEHMLDPVSALNEWWSLVKPGGWLILVVPDEDLYEQGIWPSIFNTDHKWTFRMGSESSWSKKSCDIVRLVRELKGAKILEAELQDTNYDYSLITKSGDRYVSCRAAHSFLCSLARRRRTKRLAFFRKVFRSLKIPVDQTMENALAQIQIVAQKLK